MGEQPGPERERSLPLWTSPEISRELFESALLRAVKIFLTMAASGI
jgi:hypothetical protein